jgi:MEDS: MEthanogen/methylotroph, DcmR Sensory domain
MEVPSLAGTALDPYYHVCAFFGNRDSEYQVLAPFYRETVEWNEKSLHVIDDGLRADHETRMQQHGVDVHQCQQTGQLQIVGWSETYLQDGAFDQAKMLATLQEVIEASRAEGYPRTRIMGNMNWALDGPPGAEQLIEYEARVSEVLARERQPAICVYDLNRLTGGMMLNILRAHPLTLVNGVVHHNPFFTPPEQLLAELSNNVRARGVDTGMRR